MRKAALVCSLLFAAVALSAFGATGRGGAARPEPLGKAAARTAAVSSERYAVTIRIAKGGRPLVLHIHGQASRRTISVGLKLADTALPDGSEAKGATGALLLDGGFLYEQAPGGIVVDGTYRWLRIDATTLSVASPALRTLHAMTPAPLLLVLAEATARPLPGSPTTYAGPVAYDDPAVRTALVKLTGGIEFRDLRVSAHVGRDGLVHRLLVTGRTADRGTTLTLSAHLYAFGRPLHVEPPAPGTFMDQRLDLLST